MLWDENMIGELLMMMLEVCARCLVRCMTNFHSLFVGSFPYICYSFPPIFILTHALLYPPTTLIKNRVGLSMCQALRVKWTKQRYIEIMLNDWPKMQGIYLQHFIGGAFCLPAVLGYTEPWAANLACLGVLSEMGW